VGLGVGSLLVSLLVSLPAQLVADRIGHGGAILAVSGSLWKGRAILAGGQQIGWQLSAGRSLTGLGVAGRVTLQGPGSDAAGSLLLGRGRVAIGPLDGPLSAALLQAVLPGAGYACAGGLVAQGFALHIRRDTASGAGELRSGPLDCRETATGAVLALPAAALTLRDGPQGSTARLATIDGVPLAKVDVSTDGRMTATLLAAGAALVPGLAAGGDSVLDLPLVLLFP